MSNTSKKIGVFSVILLMIASCLGIRWIPVAGAIGTSALLFWALGVLLFFIPLSLMIIELSLNYDKDGGVYLWVKEGLGSFSGFFSAWFYWTNNLFYYPGLLTFMAANLAYFIGNKDLAANHHFIVTVVIIGFWLAILLNIFGMQKIAKVAGMAGILNIGLVIFIIIAGISYIMLYHNPATPFEVANLIPHDNAFDNLSNLALLMFALGGLELIPTLAQSINKPERSLPIGVLASGIVLIVLYMAGTLAINFILTPHELSNTTGLVDAFYAVTNKLHIAGIVKVLIAAIVIVEFGAIILWLIAPTVMFFECSEPGILPKWLQQLNKNQVPANALIFQGVIVTLIILLTQYLPTVNSMYLVLVLMAAIIYFLPYLFLAIAYFRLRVQKKLKKTILNDFFSKLIAMIAFIAVLFGIGLTFVPTSDLKTAHDILIYELELIGGPAIFILVGIIIYARRA